MYALLFTLLKSISIDCPVVRQLATDLDIKYTNSDYAMQYDSDCCLGVGVVCENDRVVELHWGFIVEHNYDKPTNPTVVFPPNLRVLDLYNSDKAFTIKKLPDSLIILDFLYAFDIILDVDVFPNITYLRTSNHIVPIVARMPNTLVYLDTPFYTFDILPLNRANLREIHDSYAFNSFPRQFPMLPETIEVVDLSNCNLFGIIPFDFESIRYLDLLGSRLTGNLTISSPNITYLTISENNFDRLFVANPDKITSCRSTGVYFEPDNASDLVGLQARGCFTVLKSAPSPDCPNFVLFLKQLNADLGFPSYYSYISNAPNCCQDVYGIVSCTGNSITSFGLGYLRNLNGTFNSTLLPNSLQTISLSGNGI
eukprot:NODE_344_length_9080_cov_0.340051.p2 type:complete len:368 gc:universal NODE_344_length_9080_cov_0.340051:5644-4541(-)